MEANVLAPAPHRQYVFTIPRLLRPLFARRRAMPGKLCNLVERLFARSCTNARPGARPGLILFVQTSGDLVNFNPHIHVAQLRACPRAGPLLASKAWDPATKSTRIISAATRNVPRVTFMYRSRVR